MTTKTKIEVGSLYRLDSKFSEDGNDAYIIVLSLETIRYKHAYGNYLVKVCKWKNGKSYITRHSLGYLENSYILLSS